VGPDLRAGHTTSGKDDAQVFYIGPVVQALQDLDVDPEGIRAVISALNANARELDDGSFQRLHISPAVFGGSETAAELGFHHGKAHQIVSDTILGVVEDLTRFRDGVEQAVHLVTTADESNAADLHSKQTAVDVLVGSSGFAEGDRREQASRNEHLAAPDRTGGAADATGSDA
jgi:hypothetical protein